MSTLRSTISCLALVSAALVTSACAPEELTPSGPHAPVTADQVKLYPNAPAKYEKLAIIQVPITPEMKFDEKGDSTVGINALKAKAGAVGANGVLLQADTKLYDVFVGVGYQGAYYPVPLKYEPRTAVATAIFVLKE